MSEQIQQQPKKHYTEEQPIDDLPDSIYDQELDALTKLVLGRIDIEVGE